MRRVRGPRVSGVRRMRTWIGTLIVGAIVVGFGGLASPRLHAQGSDAAAPDLASVVYDARVTGDGNETRLELDLTREADVHAYVMAEPNRVVLDMPEVGFALKPEVHGRGAGLVTAYRYGLLSPGRSRIVADLSAPTEIVSQTVSETDIGRRLTLVLRRTALENVLTRVSAVPLPPSSAATSTPKADRAESPIGLPGVSASKDGPIVVVIDPGHGGIDSGATSRSGLLEKAVVLEFAQALAAAINDDDRFKAILTRDDDRFLPLGERVAFARKNHARLFISIHADAVRERYVRGATVYTLSERASDARAAALADKENRVDMLAGLEIASEDEGVADILVDLARRETKNFSVLAARKLVDRLEGATRLAKNPMRSARFKVLRAPDVPSVLLELGFLSNDEDAERFKQEAWRTRTVERIAAAVEGYFGLQGVGPGSAAVQR